MSATTPTLLWFRKDLRLADNAALAAAIEAGGPIVPVFIWSPEEAGAWAPGAASKWWLHTALDTFDAQWNELGGRLILAEGASLDVLRALIEQTGAGRVLWNRRYEASNMRIDANIKRQLRSEGCKVASFNSGLLNEPQTVGTGEGKPYKVYTPYWKKVKDRTVEAPVDPDLASIRFPEVWPESVSLNDLRLLPEIPWYAGTLDRRWQVGERAAQAQLAAFLKGPVLNYATDRDRPDQTGTSGLSPYLHWGHIGPRQVVERLLQQHDVSQPGPLTFLKELYWREFAYNVLYHFPETPDQPLRPEYASFPWEPDPAALEAWRRGRTGYPIVDAGMRQLWDTGWMHNRVRMIVASFLVKHLLQNWHHGARWFWDTLVDADLASNTLGWQWSGGCGADAAPYFRVFNPIIQGRKFDPDGDYVRRYVPELRKLDAVHIHTPWEAPQALLTAAGVKLGRNYPRPIIDHKEGRERALAAFGQFKQGTEHG